MRAKPRILMVGMHTSVHLARWCALMDKDAYDIHLFAFNHWPTHPKISGVTVHHTLPQRLFFHPLRVLGRLYGEPIGAGMSAPITQGSVMLRRLIRRLQPDLIHSMEFQHCGYLTLKAKEHFGAGFPPWLATNWGSDIFYYRQFPEHEAQIRRLLGAADFYSAECARDVTLARELGFAGKALPVFPNSGGFDLQMLAPLRSTPPSQRKLILVKGYQHFAGRALTALDALVQAGDALKGFSVRVFLATPDVKARIAQLQAQGMDIEALPTLPHEELLALFAQARVYLGVSVSDAISTALLEAMVMGAFPIQTHTACCDEWFEDGEGGFAIPPDDVSVIADRLTRALRDGALVDGAAQINWQVALARLDHKIIAEKIHSFYAQALFREEKAS